MPLSSNPDELLVYGRIKWKAPVEAANMHNEYEFDDRNYSALRILVTH